jgi:putative methyltransferase (TIGR04325 family)
LQQGDDMSHKDILKEFLPPVLLKSLRKLTKRTQPQKHPRYGWYGDFADWSEANAQCSGWNDPNVLETTRQTLLKVKNDRDLFEKDCLLYPMFHFPYNYQLLSAFLLISQLNNNKLHVVDFGGSLGSSYFEHRRMLSHLIEFDYKIIEQQPLVEAGKKDFEDEHLSFHHDFATCIATGKPDCVVLSGVFQYLETPVELIEEILRYDVGYIIIDRTPFYLSKPDRITIQRNPPPYRPLIIPCRIFNYNKFKECFLDKYHVVLESLSKDGKIGVFTDDGAIEPVELRFILFKLNEMP